MANKHNANLIFLDHSLSKSDMSFMEVYKRPKVAKNLGASQNLTVAFVLSAELWENSHFFENIFVNRNFNYKSFDSAKEAKNWLLKQSK